ncbi:hypothetical protein RVR_1547 [Actinacidiphila reveromycinica]|uniref:Uncharacterized protein n=1 Tax=Actinacidiphila reveromycinica TaxID=659352 RepID=A0A7U3UPG3_9ACTN|nr:DUF6059 family protein [Streptomyces sp. SN-593]BBA96308.1 hypothetical protein RVR_1547 [Streptomyces sp. SN-593]
MAEAHDALACLAWCSGVTLLLTSHGSDPEDGDEVPARAGGPGHRGGPPPGHPERLVRDQPLSAAEAALWKQILPEDPAA